MRALPYYVIELTQSQWDSGSWIESEVEDAKGKARSRVAASMDKLLTSLRLQTLSTGSYKGVMEEDGDINEDEVQYDVMEIMIDLEDVSGDLLGINTATKDNRDDDEYTD